MHKPLISIALTTYNGEKYLRKLLDSIFAQSYQNIEVIACDDNSTDSTPEILNEYAQKFGLRYHTNEIRQGFVKNFEKALTLCQGVYIALADHDDIWLNNKLEVLIKEIGNHFLIHSDAYIIDNEDNIVSNSYTAYAKKLIKMYRPHEFFFHNSVTGCTSLINKSLLEKALPFPDNCLSHDWWLALVAIKLKGIKYLNIPLIKYRQHPSNVFGAKSPFVQDIKNFLHHGLFTYERRKVNMSFYNWYTEIYDHPQLSFTTFEKNVLLDLITYHQSYFKHRIRLKAFFIHLKYFHYFYPHNNLIIRVLRSLNALFGEGKNNINNNAELNE